MIYFIEGTIDSCLEDSAIINTNGVGYQVFLPTNFLSKLLSETGSVRLYIFHHIREDAQVLYGFSTPDERKFYTVLTSVSGVGPKLGMKIMSNMNSDVITKAILEENIVVLNQLPGVGKKLAERLILDLKDKIGVFDVSTANFSLPKNSLYDDVRLALSTLGYKPKEISSALKKGEQALQSITKIEEGIKIALKNI
ncbi:Holliday junction branch migration protein RuvA [bacterium]|mgnify:CR=1 FL=1|jgi:holliday junction DNA helicase RuvA|nr:Holliday junction branch migration protein RuvA [bacterium]